MLGAIVGDIIGSFRENLPTRNKDFALFTPLSHFTDDTVLTVAVADAILSGRPYAERLKAYARRNPLRGFGPRFTLWMLSPVSFSLESFGNGSAMRVSAVGWAFDTEERVLEEARKSAECSHGHPEGVKGAQAVALAIYFARKGATKEEIRARISSRFGYDLARTVEGIRPGYRFNATCQGSVPEAIIAFLDSTSFEDAIRNAVSLGGDADTQAAIAGGIAQAHYGGVPESFEGEVMRRIPKRYRRVVEEFERRFER